MIEKQLPETVNEQKQKLSPQLRHRDVIGSQDVSL